MASSTVCVLGKAPIAGTRRVEETPEALRDPVCELGWRIVILLPPGFLGSLHNDSRFGWRDLLGERAWAT